MSSELSEEIAGQRLRSGPDDSAVRNVAQPSARPDPPPPAETDDIVLCLENVGKAYHIYDRPVDRLKQIIAGPFGKQYGQEFWALRDVSLQVRRGETFGLIGRNGSGKSTLLQMVAGVLQPTTGSVQVHGRVAALLELGSGFNPEYTGRENVFLNGAILGMSRAQMESRFDGIAEFADIDEFIDRPVKTYSSGMFMRLAFAVATSMDVDLLLIDEALAVGDIFFRQKCYQRLESLRKAGAAIVLVSHAMTEVEQFCRRALLLHHGASLFEGPANEAVKRYYLVDQQDRAAAAAHRLEKHAPKSEGDVPAGENWGDQPWPEPETSIDVTNLPQVSNGWATCVGVWLLDQFDRQCHSFEQGETAQFLYEFELHHDIEAPIGGVVLQNDKGITVHGKSTLEYNTHVPRRVRAGSRLRFRQSIALELQTVEYTFEVGLAMLGAQDFENRGVVPHAELNAASIRLCHVPNVSHFAVTFRRCADPVQLLHHGIANLPGRCELTIVSTQGAGQAVHSRV